MKANGLLALALAAAAAVAGRGDGDFKAEVSEEVESIMAEIEEVIGSKTGTVVTPEQDLRKWIGTHYVFELMNISNLELASNATMLEEAMLEASRAGGLSILQSAGHQFEGKGEGATAFVVLAESHFAVHTWPELKYVAADIFTCGSEEKAKTAAAFLAEAFGAKDFVGARLPRGIPGKLVLNQLVMSPAATVQDIETSAKEGISVEETVAHRWASKMSDKDLSKVFSNSQDDFDVLENTQSKYQNVEFIKNKRNGDICLVLDGTVQICESYNAAYSEVYVHLPVAFLSSFKTALIIGGGDALALREILKYSSVERVVQLELDEMVPRQCEKYFGVNAHLPDNPDADPRVEWIFGDAAKTIVDLVNNGEQFDLLLLDISETDPSGTVSTVDFFRHVSQALGPAGIFIKNENYQQATSTLFSEYLEVVYPVPVITQQTFVLGSNGTSLMLPNFRLLEENHVSTSFLAHGPSTLYRQLRAIVRRYSKRGLNYEAEASQEFEARNNHSPWVRRERYEAALDATVDGGTCAEPAMKPCYSETKGDPMIIPAIAWRKAECEVPPESDSIQVEFENNSPSSLALSWVNPETNEMQTVLPRLDPGNSKRLNTFFGHKFSITDLEHELVDLAQFEIVMQHSSHPYISFSGLHEPVIASRRRIEEAKRTIRRIVQPPRPADENDDSVPGSTL